MLLRSDAATGRQHDLLALRRFLLECDRLLFGTQDFIFVLLERRSDVAFLVLQGLLSQIVGGTLPACAAVTSR